MKSVSRLLLSLFSTTARPYLRTVGLLQTAKVFNKSALVWQPRNERVVVLAPHMDDETIGAGGALAMHAAHGSHITVVFLTDSSKGGQLPPSDGSRTPKRGELELTDVRRSEAQRALAILGIQDIVCLDGRDGNLQCTDELVTQLRSILVSARPSLVYLPCFLEEHPDHRAASDLLVNASDNLPFSFQCLAYEVWTPLFPNCLVRIDDTVDVKRKALSEYVSQIADSDYLHSALGLNAYRSAAFLGNTCRFAEAFLSLSIAEYRELYIHYRRARSQH